jgi:prepilin signal peptidase PulO-like enzyme (type II secretory pathway)
MALAGVVVGLLLDAAIAQLAREPYERAPEDSLEGGVGMSTDGAGVASLDLASERGALELPALLDEKSWYRRIMVVAVTSLTFTLVGQQYEGNLTHLAIVSLYASALIICSGTDLLAYRVPNVVTYPLILASLVIGMTIDGSSRPDVLLGGLLFGGLLFVPSILAGGAMGMGDVKLALFVGFALGINFVIPAMLLMALGGGAAAIFLLVTRVRGRRDPIPYAPFIAGGALVVILTQGTAFVEL